MFNQQFWIKYTFRLMHVSTLIIISGHLIFQYLFPFPCQKQTIEFDWICSIILIMSGFINTYILEPKQKMQENAAFWIKMMYLKLITTIIVISPILDVPLVVRFYFIMFWLVVSPFLRFYREYWAECHRQDLPQRVVMDEL